MRCAASSKVQKARERTALSCFLDFLNNINVILGLLLILALDSHDLMLLLTSVKSTVETCSS